MEIFQKNLYIFNLSDWSLDILSRQPRVCIGVTNIKILIMNNFRRSNLTKFLLLFLLLFYKQKECPDQEKNTSMDFSI